MKIGSVLVPNNIFLAPMAGVTDLPFRCICKTLGCGLTYTEMVSAKGLKYENKNTWDLLQTGENEQPVAVQIFGSEPAIMADMARKLENHPCDIIDINMGCPAPKIVKNNEGSALMLNMPLAGQIVKAVSRATKKPVTVKIRKGFTSEQINAVEMAKVLEENGAAAITVHGRTREQFYSGTADWDIIANVKNSVKIPVIGNGDVHDGPSAKAMFQQTNCDAVMVGRAAQGNPWIFSEIQYYLKNGQPLPRPAIETVIETALLHAQNQIDLKGEYLGIREMRKHFTWYMKGYPGANKLKVRINGAETMTDMEKILYSLK